MGEPKPFQQAKDITEAVAFINNSLHDGVVQKLYVNQKRHIVRQVRMDSMSFKFDDGRRAIITNPKSIQQGLSL